MRWFRSSIKYTILWTKFFTLNEIFLFEIFLSGTQSPGQILYCCPLLINLVLQSAENFFHSICNLVRRPLLEIPRRFTLHTGSFLFKMVTNGISSEQLIFQSNLMSQFKLWCFWGCKVCFTLLSVYFCVSASQLFATALSQSFLLLEILMLYLLIVFSK